MDWGRKNAKLEFEESEPALEQRFREDVRAIILAWYVMRRDNFVRDVVSIEMVFCIKMLTAIRHHVKFSNINCGFVIGKKISRLAKIQ